MKKNHNIYKVRICFRKKDKRKPGIWKGKVKIAKDFDTLPEKFMRHFK